MKELHSSAFERERKCVLRGGAPRDGDGRGRWRSERGEQEARGAVEAERRRRSGAERRRSGGAVAAQALATPPPPFELFYPLYIKIRFGSRELRNKASVCTRASC